MSIKIEFFSSQGCTRCVRARKQLCELVEAMHDDRLEWRTIEALEEIDYAVSVGVLATL